MSATTLRRIATIGACALAFAVTPAAGFAAKTYPDPARDVKGAPDVVSVAVSNSKTAITFRIRFASAPPLRVNTREAWVDMLLIAIDVPPLGKPPAVPGGPWPGADYALGTHGPSPTGQLVRLAERYPVAARFAIHVSGRTVTFSIPRSAIRDPASFAFDVAAARESSSDEGGAGFDVAPANGTFRYVLTG